ncbi:MAG: biotin--[acetyl-CoA-carboxylase] ligase [Bacteroidales bacterium]|jgi:BirA family biotin operon repressor/biotin-[acetyl-CoA-carboxylase] ligase|nr:biotin--[acetyl-CoA-carboxylase] ligase [Bacteroidales bacterium]
MEMKSWKRIISLSSTDSTNSYAMRLLKSDEVEEGTLVFTQEQIQGRGLGKNRWESERNMNLTFSIILFPGFLPVEQHYMLSKVISLGLLDYASSKVSGISIKWPNDIYYQDKKLAGILIENSIKGSVLNYSVAGIGLNLNQEQFVSDAPNPVSLKQITGIHYHVEDELHLVRQHLKKYYQKLQSGQMNAIHRRYIESLYRLNKFHNFRWNNRIFRAKIIGVNEYGHLQVISSTNEHREFEFKEIEFLI